MTRTPLTAFYGRSRLLKKLLFSVVLCFPLQADLLAQHRGSDIVDENGLWKQESFGHYDSRRELIGSRDAFSKHFRNDDGSISAHIASGMINYQEGGEWKTIFHSILPSANGFENTTNSHKTYYPATSSGSVTTVLPGRFVLRDMIGMHMYFETGGQKQGIKAIEDVPGMASFNQLVYANVYGSGIDLRLTQNTTQRKMDYILHDLGSIGNIPSGADYLIFEENVELPENWRAELRENVILLLDVSGNVKATYEAPVFYDTPEHHDHGEEEDHHHEDVFYGSYVIEQHGTILNVKTRVLIDWLTDAERNFPVVIDPTLNCYPDGTARWTGYHSVTRTGSSPNYHTYAAGSADYIAATIGTSAEGNFYVGRHRTPVGGTGWSNIVYNGWLKFNITSIPDNACIRTSSLTYEVLTTSSGGASCETNIYARHMANDPSANDFTNAANNQNRLADIRDGDIYETRNFGGSANGVVGVKTTSLTYFINRLQSQLSDNWYAVGLHTYAGSASAHPECRVQIGGYSHASKPYITVNYDSYSEAPSSASGGGTFCHGNTVTLSSVGGADGTGAVDVWYKGSCSEAYTERWNSAPSSTGNTTVNSVTSGILSVTSTNADPMINMYALGSFDPNTYRYLNIRYRVTSATAADNMQIFWTNSAYGGADGNQYRQQPVSSTQNVWQVVSIDMATAAGPGNWYHSNVTGWRFDWATASGVTMEIDFITLSEGPMVGTGSSVSVTPSSTETYYTKKIGNCNSTSCVSAAVTLPAIGNVLAGDGIRTATCAVSGYNWVHFYNNGELIVSVNANGGNLGNVTATSYVESNDDAILTQACNTGTDPQWTTAALGRRWNITPSNNGSAFLRLPFESGEFSKLVTASAATTYNPFDDVTAISNLKLSHYSGANKDGSWSNNCADGGTELIQAQTAVPAGNDVTVANGFLADVSAGKFVQFTTPHFSEFWLHNTSSASPLPVELENFSVDCGSAAEVKLRWTTVSEHNSHQFIVEKSRDGNLWTYAAEAAAAGNSSITHHYTIADPYPFSGISYYRLVQVDINGQRKIHGPVSVSCRNEVNALHVFPNPSKGSFTVRINSTRQFESADLQLIDMAGKIVEQKTVFIGAGSNHVFLQNESLQTGMYIIRVRTENNLFTPVKVEVMD